MHERTLAVRFLFPRRVRMLDACHRRGRRLDLVAATQHDKLAREDYRLCRSAGIHAVREAARWPLIDRTGLLDLDGVRELARIGREEGIAQIWDLMHYGYPDDLDPFTPAFRERFVAYARAVAQSSAR